MLIQRIKLGRIAWAAAIDVAGYVIKWVEDRKSAVHIEADAWPATAKHYDGKANVDKVNLVDGKKVVETVSGVMPPPPPEPATPDEELVRLREQVASLTRENERMAKEKSYLHDAAFHQIEEWKSKNAKLTEENAKLKADLVAAEELKGEAAASVVSTPPVSPPKA